VNTTERKYKG